MAQSLLRVVTEPAVFVPEIEVAKQHDVFVHAIASGILVRARAGFGLDEIIRKLFECFNEDLPKLVLVPRLKSQCLKVLTRQIKYRWPTVVECNIARQVEDKNDP